jgi:hypothetical protein
MLDSGYWGISFDIHPLSKFNALQFVPLTPTTDVDIALSIRHVNPLPMAEAITSIFAE